MKNHCRNSLLCLNEFSVMQSVLDISIESRRMITFVSIHAQPQAYAQSLSYNYAYVYTLTYTENFKYFSSTKDSASHFRH